jgi:4-diphosphocytidyl-2-C-methyl-D-erythritol kinase
VSARATTQLANTAHLTAPITEAARAKVNLTLKVHGKRADGYHELESLVAFADASDLITLDLNAAPDVAVSGPFGPSIAGENLIRVVLDKLSVRAPQLRLGKVTLEKRLPIAAGVGGGSADAGALLRAIRVANPDLEQTVDWLIVAAEIGADVPVCFHNRATVMRGLGEMLEDVSDLPALDIVLVNPQVPVAANKTALVFRALAAEPLVTGWQPKSVRMTFPTRQALLQFMTATGNDLMMPAAMVVPEIQRVREALAATAGAEYVALSGGGPTCFAVYPNGAAAEQAQQTLSARNPSWWVTATRVT